MTDQGRPLTERSGRRRALRAAAAVALLAALLAAGCNGADDAGGVQISEDAVAADAGADKSGYCAAIDQVMADASPASSAVSGSEDGAAELLAAFSAYAQFRTAIEDLADTAPPEITDEYATMRESFSTVPDLSDPLTAVAAALYMGLDLQIAADRIDAVTQEQCGTTLFTIDVAEIEQITTPYVDDDGATVVDARNLFGEHHCDVPGRVVGASSQTSLVISCEDLRYLGVDLESYQVDWSYDRPVDDDTAVADDDTAVNDLAGVMAMIHVETEAASGFDGERREVIVTGVGLDDGTEAYTTALPRPDGRIDETEIGGATVDPSIQAMGADGTTIVQMTWPMTEGNWVPRLYGIAPDGSVSWTRDSDHYVFMSSTADEREYAELSAPNLPADVVSISTGESVVASGVQIDDTTTIISDGCSPIFAVVSGSGTAVFNAATGKAHRVDGMTGTVTPAAQGAFVEGFNNEADERFVTPSGVAWTMEYGMAVAPQVAYGRLFLENQSGVLLEVNQATGEPVSDTAAEAPPAGFPVDGGLLVAEGISPGPIRLTLIDTEVLCG